MVMQIYVTIAILALLFIIYLAFSRKKRKKEDRINTLRGLALAFILVGIIFGGNRLVGYVLIGVGVLFAIIDIISKSKKPRRVIKKKRVKKKKR